MPKETVRGKVLKREEAKKRGIMLLTPGSPLAGDDDTQPDLLCGHCGTIIATGVRFRNLLNGVLRCANCGAMNELGAPVPNRRKN
jgi:hypothetical protein